MKPQERHLMLATSALGTNVEAIAKKLKEKKPKEPKDRSSITIQQLAAKKMNFLLKYLNKEQHIIWAYILFRESGTKKAVRASALDKLSKSNIDFIFNYVMTLNPELPDTTA